MDKEKQAIEMYPTRLTDLSLLDVHPDNPNLIKDAEFDKLCNSIEENFNWLWANNIVVSDRGDGELVIISGEKRYYACLELGYTEAPVCFMHGLTDEEEHDILVLFNVHAGKMSTEILLKHYDQEKLKKWGLDISFPAAAKKAKKKEGPKVEMNVKHICPECGHKF